MAAAKRKRKRWVRGAWIALARQVRARSAEEPRAPTDLWMALVFPGAEDRETIAMSFDVSRERALQGAVGRALRAGRPEAIHVESDVRADRVLDRFAVPVAAVSRDHDNLLAWVEELLPEQARAALDPELDEAAAFAGFLDAAGMVVTALTDDGDTRPAASALVAMPGQDSRAVLVWSGATPAIVIGAERDYRLLCDAADDGRVPPCDSIGVVFTPSSALSRAGRRAIRPTGWSHDLVPVVRATDVHAGAIDASPAQLRELTDILHLLLSAGAASACRGQLGSGVVRVALDGGARITWHLGGAADVDDAPPQLH